MAQVDLVTQIEAVQRVLCRHYSDGYATPEEISALEAVLRTMVWLAANRAAVIAAKEKGP